MPVVVGLLLFSQCFFHGRGLSAFVVPSLSLDRVLWLVILAIGLPNAIGVIFTQRKTTPLLFLTPFFALVCTFSWFVSGVDPTPDGKYRFLALIVNFIYIPATIYIACSANQNPEKSLRLTLTILSWLGVYLCVTAIGEHYGLDALVWPKYILDPSVGIQFGRARGPFASSSELGTALVVTFLASACRSRFESKWQRMTTALILVVHAVAIYFTYTRSSWLAFAAAVVVLALAQPRLRYTLGLLTAFILLMAFTGVTSKFTLGGRNLFTERLQTVDYRRINYLTTLRMALDNPVFGVGYGRFYREWPKYYKVPSGTKVVQELTDGNHNTFLGIFAELGLVGIGSYLMILFRISIFSFRVVRRKSTSRFARDAAVTVLAAGTAFMVDAQFLDYRSSRFFVTSLFALFGYLVALNRLETTPEDHETSSAGENEADTEGLAVAQ